MRLISAIYTLLFVLAFTNTHAQNQTYKLSGTILDAENNEPIAGATVYLPNIKKGVSCDANGQFELTNIPQEKISMQASFVGYKTASENIDLTQTKQIEIKLKEAITEIGELVVTGQAGFVNKKRTPTPITMVSKSALLESNSTNIIDALAKEPGVSQVSTGAGISKPVIRGLGYNRVIVVNDGVRQEGQQWGDEHGIEIDQASVDHVEILKGPASLAFGSDAMAGVINMISAPILPTNTVRGSAMLNYQTNNNLWGYSANAEGNNNDWLWGIRLSGKRADDYQNSIDGKVDNSAFNDNAISTMFGRSRKSGYTHLHMSYYDISPEIPSLEEDHEHDDDHDHDHAYLSSDEDDEHDHDHEEGGESQKIQHYKAVIENKDFIGKGSLSETIGFQQNRRKEFESTGETGMYIRLNTLSYDFKYQYHTDNDWNFTTGIGGMYQDSKNLGVEYLIPDYDLFDIGLYGIAHKQLGNFDISGGLRYDHRSTNGDELLLSDGSTQFYDFSSSFGGISGSLGATYQINNEWYTKLGISRGYRSPNIAELGSNGTHHGSYSYQLGNPDLSAEHSIQLDWGLGVDSRHVYAELNLFSNHIDNYIYNHKVASSLGGDSIIDSNPVYKYNQGKAHLYGGEFYIDIHPHPWHFLHFQNTLSYTRGVLKDQPDSLTNLPNIPPLNWQSELKFELGKTSKITDNTNISIGLEHNWEQDKYFEAYNTETYTASYTTFNASVGTDFVYGKKHICSLYISCDNIGDKAYQSHLSRLKYAGHNDATGRDGYFNMGRNFSFKLIVPFGS